MEFHNVNADMCRSMYAFNETLIRKVCKELGNEDRSSDMVEKFLSKNFIKLKPMKDPTKPKRSLSAYMLFCNDVRVRIMKDNEGVHLGGISKLIASEWQSLPTTGKKKYHIGAEEEREKYEDAILDWKVQN